MTHMRRSGRFLFSVLVLAGGSLWAQAGLVTSFEKGKDGKPEGWQRAGSPGKWEREGHTGERSVSVTGNGENHGRWIRPNPSLEPSRTYRFSVWYKSQEKGAGINSILVGINSSFKKFPHSEQWTQAVLTFRTPADGKDMAVRLSHFRFNGTVWFDDLRIEPVEMVFLERDGVHLGENERIEKGQYLFEPDMRSPHTNCYRVTIEQTVTHHENRMWFRGDDCFVHKYQVGAYPQIDAELFLKINQEGGKKKDKTGKAPRKRPSLKGKIEISNDGKQWDVLKPITAPGDLTVPIPKTQLPARAIFVRVSGGGNFQIPKYRYSARLDGSPPDMTGRTEAFRANHLILDNGALRLVIEAGEGPVASICRKGRAVGRIELLVAQFEKKGVGYKKTGIGTALAERVKDFAKTKASAGGQVAEVLAERTTSEPARRKFEAVYRITLPDGEPWFEGQLLSVKNTDAIQYKIIGYNQRIQPHGAIQRPSAHAWEELAAWIGEKRFLGALATQAGDFVFGFRADFGDITRRVEAALPPGQTWTGAEPGLVIYVGEGTGDAFDRETSRIRRRFGLPGIKRLPPEKPKP